mmetsp:Transcript_54609/g.97978  ORF Transcript_54609/g.97978 Transcript_54609/m.97978 type:complete len:507 (-) Transcript_54609:76-1596(-)
MAMPVKRLGTSRSESGLSVNSRLSDSRREKLINLKKREDLKDALTEKFRSRFGHTASQRGPDEVSVASVDIQNEVHRFAEVADVTEANLGRLERRLHRRAVKGPAEPEVMSTVSGVSAYSTMSKMSRSRSLASIGENVIGGGGPGFDWSRLDEYASYLHEQDALRQKAGVHALQKKLRKDLDAQVSERKAKLNENDEEERRYHSNMMIELERWKATEQARAEELRNKLMREKKDRDEQLAYERHLKDEAADRKRSEEAALVDKIVNEMEAEQRRFEKKKMDTKKAMRKVFEENEEDQRKRQEAHRVQKEKDAHAMREYNRILDEQEEQRAEELAARMERQKTLMDQLQANVAAQAKDAGDNDALRAQKQQDEMDRHYAEAEKVKQSRLKQLRLETQAYLFKQMAEKDARKDEEKELQNIQAQILERDTEEYNDIEREKMTNRKIRNFEHRKEIERQIEQRSKVRVPEMSEAEMKMNRNLLTLVDKTLQVRDERAMAAMEEYEAEEY